MKEMWPVHSLVVLVILVCWELRRSLERLWHSALLLFGLQLWLRAERQKYI